MLAVDARIQKLSQCVGVGPAETGAVPQQSNAISAVDHSLDQAIGTNPGDMDVDTPRLSAGNKFIQEGQRGRAVNQSNSHVTSGVFAEKVACKQPRHHCQTMLVVSPMGVNGLRIVTITKQS